MRHGLERFKTGCRCNTCLKAKVAAMRQNRLIDNNTDCFTKEEVLNHQQQHKQK